MSRPEMTDAEAPWSAGRKVAFRFAFVYAAVLAAISSSLAFGPTTSSGASR